MSNHISFINKRKDKYKNSTDIKSTQKLFLLDSSLQFNIFEFIPKRFTITTNSGSSNFNIEFLKDTSTIISEFNKENPNYYQYHLDINDTRNVLGKFEQMYQGNPVIFDEDDIPIAKQITSSLKIKCCPNYIQQNSLNFNFYKDAPDLSDGIVMSKQSLNSFLKNESLRTFIIKTNKQEYKCNVFGVYSSSLIREILQKDSSINKYTYDFDDEFGEFQMICDIFNFQKVNITANNMSSLKEIAEDFRIDKIATKIDKYIKNYDTNYDKIDKFQDVIDSIDELFEWLYNIKNLTVDSVKNSIVDSIWSQTEENVLELAAFILQAINSDILLHQYLCDLLVQLNKEANETNKLNILIPFVVKKLMLSFGKSNLNCSFIFKLFKKGFIPKEKIINQLNNLFKNSNYLHTRRSFYRNYVPFTEINLSDSESLSSLSTEFCFAFSWFLPEIIEINKFDEKIIENAPKPFGSFIKSYLPDKIEEYKKMRDSGEPDDEITKALRSDNVDFIQSFISRSQDLSPKLIVAYNLFEDFVPNGESCYLNYSAAYGSVKCFKYLLLNHEKCDESTFSFAVYGGNTEIIKIVDQNTKNQNNNNDDDAEMSSSSYYEEDEEELLDDNKDDGFSMLNKIIPSITKHQNNLFDWIFENKFMTKELCTKFLHKLTIDSALNGNVHSLIEIIDKGFDLALDELFNDVFRTACENGFYRLSEIIFSVFNNENDVYYFDNIIHSVSFGNISIFKYYLKMKKNHKDLEKAFLYAVLYDLRNILDYFFENLVNEGFQLSDKCISKSLNISVLDDSCDLYFYLIEKYKQTNPLFNESNFSLDEILSNACTFGNFIAVKAITELIIKNYKINNDDDFDQFKTSFTSNFIKAAALESMEICQYLLDKKVPIDFSILSLNANELSSLDSKVFSSVIEKCNLSEKNLLLHYSLSPAIEKRNYDLVEYLLKENVINEDALINAIEKDDLKMVNLILKYRNEPFFINKSSRNGTALCIAVKNNQLQIVKTLLSIPGINPNLCDHNYETPLILSVPNIEIMNQILDFYGDDIIFQSKQLNITMKKILRLLFLKVPEAMPVLYRILEIKNIQINELIDNDNFLTYACKMNNVDVAKIILNMEKVDVNVLSPKNGDTPLIIAIKENSNDVADLLIEDERVNLNAINYDNKTAFMIACNNQQDRIIELLINNKRFNPIESHLDDVFITSSSQIQMKILSAKSFDINRTLICKQYQMKIGDSDDLDESESLNHSDDSDSYNSDASSSSYSDDSNKNDKEIKSPETILLFAVRTNNLEMIDFVIQHPSFDCEKSHLGQAILMSIKQNNLEIFKKLIQLLNSKENCSKYDHSNFLTLAIQEGKIDIITEILNNTNFYCKENSIFNIFCKNLFSIEQNSFEIMKILYNYDKEHNKSINLNKLSSIGETVFTSICLYPLKNNDLGKTIEIVNFLIEKGADPNIQNEKGKYALQHAIELNSIDFVRSLINSNKVDFTKRMKNLKNKTFLHLAAESKNPLILKDLLHKNVIDINSTDDLGETPLMDACRFNRKTNIELLFKNEKLDYLHCNKKGEDALKIVQDPWNKNTGFLNNKDNYRQVLLIHLKNRTGPPFDYDSDSNKILIDFSSSAKIPNLDHLKSDPNLPKLNNSDFEAQKRNINEKNIENDKVDYSSNYSIEDHLVIENLPSLTIKTDQENSQSKTDKILLKKDDDKNQESSKSNFDSLPPLKRHHSVTIVQDKNENTNQNEIQNHPLISKSDAPIHPNGILKNVQSSSIDSSCLSSKTEKSIEMKKEGSSEYIKEQKKVQLPSLCMSSSSSSISPRLLMNKVKSLQKLADKGNPDAQYSLGVCYALGNGVPENKEKALMYYLMAAEQGNMNAQYTAASCYSYGKGTEINKEKAFELYLKAAEQGFDKAQFAVGHFYEYGQGGAEKNHDKAMEWYIKAANQGHKASLKVLKNK